MPKRVILVCEVCKQRNYTTTKHGKKQSERIEVKKFCGRCNKHTIHRETK